VRVTLGVLTAMLGALLTVGIVAGPATAAPRPAVVQTVAAHGNLAVGPTTTPAPPTTGQTDFNKGQQQADAALAKRKLILVVVCVVLLVIVYFGRRAKGKHVLRLKNLQNAKS